jgi:hypothetical protein
MLPLDSAQVNETLLLDEFLAQEKPSGGTISNRHRSLDLTALVVHYCSAVYTPRQIVDDIRSCEEIGITELRISATASGVEAIERFAEEVRARV